MRVCGRWPKDRSSNLHRPRQIKRTVSVSDKSIVWLHFPSSPPSPPYYELQYSSFPDSYPSTWISSLSCPIVGVQLCRSCKQLPHREASWSTPSRWRGSSSLLLQLSSEAGFFHCFLVVFSLLVVGFEDLYFLGEERRVCSLGGMEKGWWSIIAESTEGWNVSVRYSNFSEFIKTR